MTIDGRLDRLYPGLTAKERAVLVLRALKEGHEEDWRVRTTAPDGQVDAFNRYMRLINCVNRDLSLALLLLREQFVQVELKRAWFMTALLLGDEMRGIAAYMLTETKEPITESGLAARTDEYRAELLSLDEATSLITDDHEWDDADCEVLEGVRCATDEAWDRVFDEERKKLAGAVRSGALKVQGKGSRARVRVGDLYDWWGEPFVVLPEWGWEFDVRPDAEAASVEKRTGFREAARKRLGYVIAGDDWPVDVTKLPTEPDHDALARSLAVALLAGMRRELLAYWSELQAIEIVTGEISDELGEDVMVPDMREMADDLAGRMRSLAEAIQPYAGETRLGEPTEEAMTMIRRAIERAERDG